MVITRYYLVLIFSLLDSVRKNKEITTKVPRIHQITKRRQASFILQILEFFYPHHNWSLTTQSLIRSKTRPQAPTAWVACGLFSQKVRKKWYILFYYFLSYNKLVGSKM